LILRFAYERNDKDERLGELAIFFYQQSSIVFRNFRLFRRHFLKTLRLCASALKILSKIFVAEIK